ncbi:hypothetical protein [Photobacterium damselae]|uniref:hypothetical protein n=1 Tax=Photobacterium damselae TaxID=38293 RepID=UPI0040675D31
MAQTISDGVLLGATEAMNAARLKIVDTVLGMLSDEERDRFARMVLLVYRMNDSHYSIEPMAASSNTFEIGGEITMSAIEETSVMVHSAASVMVGDWFKLSNQSDIDNHIIKDAVGLVKDASITRLKTVHRQNLLHGVIGAFKRSYPQDIMFDSEKKIIFIDRNLSEWL